ncbi:rhombosortase [Aliidiomarina haloalkalitolerans]|nr:rhombosortase [Aliidiomarina haloalkalitolerans]MCL4409842.1 rhombosortase [Gammaproteobacteria bacterium]
MTKTFPLRFLLAPVVIALLCVVIHLQPQWHNYLTLSENSLLAQPWRIFTTHLVHLNIQHLAMNLVALLLLAIIFRQQVQGRLLVNVMVISALFATIVPIAVSQEYLFVGLSGVLHGVVVFAGVTMTKQGNKIGFIVLAAVVVKLIFDMTLNSGYQDWLGAEVAYLCHLGGAIGGALAVPGLRRRPIDLVKKQS